MNKDAEKPRPEQKTSESQAKKNRRKLFWVALIILSRQKMTFP